MKWWALGVMMALVVVFALAPAVAMAAPAITQGIQGVVKDATTGLPVPFAEVHVDFYAGGHIDYITTDYDGTYSIEVDANDYSIEADSRRHEYQGFGPVTVAAGEVTTQDFSLDRNTWTPEQPVYRFFNMQAGVHFYTANDEEFLNVYKNLPSFHYDGIAYWVPWGTGDDPEYANPNTLPLYRFYNTKTGVHFYTKDEQEKATIQSTLSDVYSFEGVAYNVTGESDGTLPVYRFYVPSRSTHFFTGDSSEILSPKSQLSDMYQYEGVGFYIGDWTFVGSEG